MTSLIHLKRPVPAICLSNICFGIVEKLSLSLAPKEKLALIGPSGCGKTTTLRLIAGFEQPESGTIQMGGATVSAANKLVPPYKRKIAMVFQDLALWPHMTARQHLAFVLPKSVKRRQRQEKIMHLLNLVHLPYPDKYPGQLSGGEQQRLALARALAQAPDILLMDEPFSSLDTDLRNTLLQEVRTLLDQLGITTIYVTHDMREAAYMADRVAVLNQGRLKTLAPAREFFSTQKHTLSHNRAISPEQPYKVQL
ncbi:ABC transporter ATP-binding protein [Desulfogranum japonicum]|uniref:ABC transporter ATP-binding protein n=1 Tax=Desulfogranum japonicum TaxID=231447 RepID=UPI000421AE41|nr:ABC transporter ATP-binding protein [Desulfogranum japonicum]